MSRRKKLYVLKITGFPIIPEIVLNRHFVKR